MIGGLQRLRRRRRGVIVALMRSQKWKGDGDQPYGQSEPELYPGSRSVYR